MSLDLSRKNRATRRKVHARRARLQLESLEQRRLMAIVANAGDPFFLDAAENLVVSASVAATPPAPAATYTYNWDLNYDGDYGDPEDFSTTSSGAIIPAATLALSGINAAALAGGPITIGLQIIQSGTGAIGLDTAKVYASGAVIANANGPYAIEEGEEFEFPIDPNFPNGPTALTALVLDASGSVFAGSSAIYSWNLDSDPAYEFVTTQRSLRLSWAELEALNTAGPFDSVSPPIDGLDPADVRTISVTVDPASGGSSTAFTTLSILNVAPSELTASISSFTLFPKPLTGGQVINTPFAEELTLDITGNDPSTVDLEAGLTYTIDWGDGTGVDTVISSNIFVFPPPTHTYAVEGTFTISVTVTDKDGGARNIFQQVRASRVYADETGSIYVHGTGNNDRIIVTGNQIGGISIRMNNTFYPPISLTAGGLPIIGGSLYIYGNDGNDTISIATSQLSNIEIYGGTGDDYIAAGNEGNIIYGGAGDDRIISYAGADQIFGDGPNDPEDLTPDSNSGNDYISAGAGNDFAEGGPGNDTINGEGGDDILYGGIGNDKLNGGIGNDQLFEEAGTNILDGADGNDLLYGSSGRDTMYGRNGQDVIIGNGGLDTLYGGNDDDLLIGNIVGDQLDARMMYELWTTGKNFTAITNNYILPAGKITEDGAADVLYGDSGNDWFVAYLADAIKDFKLGDAKTVNGIRLA